MLLIYGSKKRQKMQELKSFGCLKIIDLYEEIRYDFNFVFTRPIYKYEMFKDYSYNYLIKIRNLYLSDKCAHNLRALIRESLLRFDFLYTFKYIDEYIDNEFEDLNYYIELKKDICKLFERIKSEISNRRQKDIIVNWLDQVCYKDIEVCRFLKSKSESGICFENAYTITPYTKPTIRYIFFNEKIISSSFILNFIKGNKTCADSKLVKVLKKCGYEIFFLTPDEGKGTWDSYGDNYETNFPSTIRYWEALECILLSDKPVFMLIDTLRETHEPFWNPEIDTIYGMQLFRTNYDDEIVKRQIEDSLKYVDRELEFYFDFWQGTNQIIFFMSDHGKWNQLYDRRYYDKAVHTLLFYVTNSLTNRKEKRIFPLCNLGKLVVSLITGKRRNIFRHFIFLEDVEIFDDDLQRMMDDLDILNKDDIAASFRAIQTSKKKWICLGNHRHIILNMPNEEPENNINIKDKLIFLYLNKGQKKGIFRKCCAFAFDKLKVFINCMIVNS